MVFAIGPAGTGKCLGKGTPVLMYSGEIKPVEEVKIGDLIMGPDSSPRTVISLARGIDEMYKVIPVKGDSYIVNQEHVLALVKSSRKGRTKERRSTTISVKNWLQKGRWFKREWKGYRVPVEFKEQPVSIDPYFLGLWIGDGNSHNVGVTTFDTEIKDYVYKVAQEWGLQVTPTKGDRCPTYSITSGTTGGVPEDKNLLLNEMRRLGALNKFEGKSIPLCYISNSQHNRLKLLAGLIDSDGSASDGGYEIISKWESLANQIVFLSRTLGLAAYVKPTQKQVGTDDSTRRTYYRIFISGDTSGIPIKLARKKNLPRKQKKDVLVTGIKLEPLGQGEYFGFEIDGDGLFLLGDCTVTHNTYLAVAKAVTWLKKKGNRLILARPAVEAGEKLGFLPGSMQEKVDPYLRPLYDALYALMEPAQVDRYIELGIIEIAPLAFMRGRTLDNAFIILDEAQNTTDKQMQMFLTRMGNDSKMVITGDDTQIDLPNNQVSGLLDAEEVLEDVDGIHFHYFEEADVVRHPLVQKICNAYAKKRNREGEEI